MEKLPYHAMTSLLAGFSGSEQQAGCECQPPRAGGVETGRLGRECTAQRPHPSLALGGLLPESRSQPAHDSQFAGLGSEGSARRPIWVKRNSPGVFEDVALDGCRQTRWWPCQVIFSSKALPPGQLCHGFMEERALVTTTCPNQRRGEEAKGQMAAVRPETWGFSAPGSRYRELGWAGRHALGSGCGSWDSSFAQRAYFLPHQK